MRLSDWAPALDGVLSCPIVEYILTYDSVEYIHPICLFQPFPRLTAYSSYPTINHSSFPSFLLFFFSFFARLLVWLLALR